MLLQRGIEMIQHKTRLDLGSTVFDIHIQDGAAILAVVDHQPCATVWPQWLVPAPRGTIGTFRSRAMSMAVDTSEIVPGHEHAHRHHW